VKSYPLTKTSFKTDEWDQRQVYYDCDITPAPVGLNAECHLFGADKLIAWLIDVTRANRRPRNTKP
jgi:hypothetical protein